DVITIILRNEPASLPATGIIDVYVKDENDLPIQGAYVRVISEIAYSGYTGEKGEYSVKELYLGLYNITVSMKGYSDGTASTRIDYVGDRDRVYITLYPEESTSIRLYTSIPGELDQTGGSYVRYKLDDGSFSKWYLTDESGQFEIPNAKLGTYTIEILRGGFELQTQTVAVSEIGVIINAGTVLDIHAADGVTDYYALIVAGQYDRRFTIDAFAMYATLQNYYGFSSQKMYLLTPRTHHPISDNELPYDRLTSKANVQWAIGEIAFYADADDKVLVWWTGHGGYDSMDTHTNTISAAEFAAALDSVICEEMCIYLGPCHSGSLIGDLNDKANRAIYTSCASNEGGHATYDHSYWPWATYNAIHPLVDYSDADDNSNGYISMFEIFDYAYDYITVTRGYTDQHPQRWVGADVNDFNLYPGDGIPTSGIVESSLSYLVMSNGNDQGDLYDGTPEVDIIASASILDNEFDNDDFSFQAINSSDPHQSLVSDVTIDVYLLNGTLYASDITDSEGMVTFYDVPINDYAWEATYQDLEVDSGHLVSDGFILSVYAYAENWDHQGDYGDIRFNAEEANSHIFAPDVVITLYRNDGTIIDSGMTDYIGAVYFYDFADGSYAWEATFEGTLVDEGIISIDSSLFILETDNSAPVVSIERPTSGEVIDVTEKELLLEYTVVERNNYTIDVLINGVSIGFKSNGSSIREITENGEYSIRVIATDIAGNSHYDEVSVTVVGYPPLTTESIATTESSVSRLSPGFEFICISSLLVFLLVVKRRKKEV
ncbi:MAG: carboxypeptidase regulatory-like domain-containing protein, partial [Promethearchaeota archaeon]